MKKLGFVEGFKSEKSWSSEKHGKSILFIFFKLNIARNHNYASIYKKKRFEHILSEHKNNLYCNSCFFNKLNVPCGNKSRLECNVQS